MAKKKVTKKRTTKKKKSVTKKSSVKKKSPSKKKVDRKVTYAKLEKPRKQFPLRERTDVAWKNFLLFLILLILSYVMYHFSTADLFLNLFGIFSIIFGFLAFAFLLAFIVLEILKASSRRKAQRVK